jgi:hypothetical protein
MFVANFRRQLDIHAQLLNAVAVVFFWHACWTSLRLHIPASAAAAATPASGNAGLVHTAVPGGKAPAGRMSLEQRRRERATAVAIGYARIAFLGLKALQDMAAQPAVSRCAHLDPRFSFVPRIPLFFSLAIPPPSISADTLHFSLLPPVRIVAHFFGDWS